MRAALNPRDPSHARLIARAHAATPPPDNWWTRTNLTREQWSALAAEHAQRMNAVTTTHHVQRGEGDA